MTFRSPFWMVPAFAAAIALVAAPAASAATSHDETTSLLLTVTNVTSGTLTLKSAVNSHGHWQDRPSATLAPGASTSASSYDSGINGSKITLGWGTADGTTITVEVTVPLTGSNSGGSTVSAGTEYGADVHVGSGFASSSTALIYQGRSVYPYTGSAATFTVPEGAAGIDFVAIGGSGPTTYAGDGARLTGFYGWDGDGGTEYTIGVGQGGVPGATAWGLPNGPTDCYCGGSSENYPGGAATVIIDPDGDPVAVAAGGGGAGEGRNMGESVQYQGGNAGDPLGGNDGEGEDSASGGRAGSQSTAAGQSSSGENNGGGGGGLLGGGAGTSNASGGSGSSFLNAEVENASNSTNGTGADLNGSVTITPIWSTVPSGEPQPSIVTFDPANGEPSFQLAAFPGSTISEPDSPERDGFAFSGWFTDTATKWDFATAPTGNLTLTAQWQQSATDTADPGEDTLAATGGAPDALLALTGGTLALIGAALVLRARKTRTRAHDQGQSA